jgi:hypothetical protein
VGISFTYQIQKEMAKAKKELTDEGALDAPLSFEVKIGEESAKYQIIAPNAYIPKIGVVTAEELLQMPEVLAMLVEINSGTIKKL